MSTTTPCLPTTPGMETQFVEADAYCRLLTSRRHLVRMDEPARGLRGVLDPSTRIHYVVEERNLLRSRQPNRLATTPDG